MDGTHKHAIHAPHWFILPCLVHIALLLIYLLSRSSHHLTGVYLSCLVCAPVSVDVHMLCHFSICVSVCVCVCVYMCVCVCVCVFTRMSLSAFACERHSVWHDKRWPSLCVLHPIPVMACRTQVSVVMVTVVSDSFSVPGRQICVKHFPLLSGLFPLVFYGEV